MDGAWPVSWDKQCACTQSKTQSGQRKGPAMGRGQVWPHDNNGSFSVTQRVLPQGHAAVSLALLAGSWGPTSPRGSGAAGAPSGHGQQEGPGQVLATSGADKLPFPDDILNILSKGARVCF